MHTTGDYSNSLPSNSTTVATNSMICKSGSATTIDCLPDELLCHIFVSLEADYLYDNVRAVSRRWSRLISSNAFRKSHLERSPYGLLVTDKYGGGHPMLLTVTEGGIQKWEFSYQCRTNLSASCNGLAMEIHCMSTDQYVLHILNPATKQAFPLPDFPFHIGRQLYSGTFGVAYAVHSLQYKVALPYVAGEGDSMAWALAILTLEVDKAWRDLPVMHLSKASRSVLGLSPLITQGYMHWAEGNWTEFLTLDVDNEIITVGEVPLHPLDYLNARFFFLSTGTSLSDVVAHGSLVWEIWVMEQGRPEWRKLSYDINMGDLENSLEVICGGQMDQLLPFGWINYPKVLSFYLRGNSMSPLCICYDLDTCEIECLYFTSVCSEFQTVVHKSSLIWLN